MQTAVNPKGFDASKDEAAIPLVPQLVPPGDGGAQDALAKLADEAARATAKLRPAAAADFSAGPRVTAAVLDTEPSLHADDRLAADRLAAEPMAPPRNGGRGVTRFLFAIAIGVGATLAWQSYGQAARQMIAAYVPLLGPSAPVVEMQSTGVGRETDRSLAQSDANAAQPPLAATSASAAPAAPSPELAQQIETMARDLAALRDGMAKVSTVQDQMIRSIAKLQEADEEAHRKATTPPRPAPARKPVAAAPRPQAPPPVTSIAPRPTAQAVTSTPLPPLSAPPPAGALPEPPRRPPASMP